MKFSVRVSNSIVTLKFPKKYEKIPDGDKIRFLRDYLKYWFYKPTTTFTFFLKSLAILFFACIVMLSELWALSKMVFDLLVIIPVLIVLPSLFGYRPVYYAAIEQEEEQEKQELKRDLVKEYLDTEAKKAELRKRLESKRRSHDENDTDQ